MREVRPLRSPGITPLRRYYEPVRLPAAANHTVMDSHGPLRRRQRATPGLPGPSLTLSTRALPTHPGQLDACVCSLLPHRLQASAPSEAWPLPLVSRGRIGFACAGPTFSLSSLVSDSPGHTPDRPVSRVGLPAHAGPKLHVERAIHMADTSQSARASRVTLAHRRHDGAFGA